jgi:hypothetical protein
MTRDELHKLTDEQLRQLTDEEFWDALDPKGGPCCDDPRFTTELLRREAAITARLMMPMRPRSKR